MDLLKNIAWAFNGTNYAHQDEFDKAVAQYQRDIYEDDSQWQPDTVVLESPEVRIIYEYYITPNDIRFEDETFPDEDEADIQIDDPDEENEQREVAVTFKADNGRSFTASELLYKLHQRLWHRQLGDHIFFEGLLVCKVPEQEYPPSFYLHCGS